MYTKCRWTGARLLKSPIKLIGAKTNIKISYTSSYAKIIPVVKDEDYMVNKDLVGQKFNRLTVLSFAFKKNNSRMWECQCDCRKLTYVSTNCLTSGHTKSCGCLYLETRGTSNLKHGGCKELVDLYHVWENVKARCYNPKYAHFEDYGGRGITVETDWFKSFEVFSEWALANGYESGLSLERKDVNGNYEPRNCTWVTKQAQCWNKRNSRRIFIDNKEVSLSEYFYTHRRENNVDYANFSNRVCMGWDIEKALTVPVNTRRKK